ncbi:MAG: alpha/beta hydrolase-fold protein [Ginsengibacter sp.]
MKKIINNSMLLLVSLLLLNTSSSFAQETITPQVTNSKSYIIKSGTNKKDYAITVMLPKAYSVSDSIKYPVLYVLDGKYNTASFYSIKETFALGKEVKDIIFVTIDANVQSESEWLTNRYTDLTPSSNPPSDTAIANYFKLPVSPSGGGSDFLATIEKDIIPFVEHNYKTNNERGIFGHSLGGLFVAYCLLTKPNLFQKYSMNSPSIWWTNGGMVALADSMSKQNPNIAATIFISAGSLEGDFMIAPVNNFIQALKSNFSNLNITSKIFEDETHLSVVPAASSRTLKVLYAQ